MDWESSILLSLFQDWPALSAGPLLYSTQVSPGAEKVNGTHGIGGGGQGKTAGGGVGLSRNTIWHSSG